MSIRCGICSNRLLSHSLHIRCSVCNNCYHIKCLPNVDRTDTIYTERKINEWMCINCSEHTFPFNHFIDNDEFLQALSENLRNCNNISFKILNEKIFNPFEINEGNNNISLFDIDPDFQYFSDVNQCYEVSDYFLEDTFVNKCSQLSVGKCFSIIHMNIRSMSKNLDAFVNYLPNLDLLFSVIGLSETWLKDSNVQTLNITGYNQENVYRSDKVGGGVSIFVLQAIEYQPRNDLNVLNQCIEAIFVEINKDQIGFNRNVICGVIYRPPNTSIHQFSDHISEILSKIKHENKIVYLSGDYNIDLLNVDNHLPSSEFIENMYSHSFIPLINKPTRVSNVSATLIDNIYCNDVHSNQVFKGILYTDISDHFPIFCINLTNLITSKSCNAMTRSLSQQNINIFYDALRLVNWQAVQSCTDCQQSYTLFYELFYKCYDECFPLRIIKNNYHNRKTWLTAGLKQSIKVKNKLYVNSKKHPTIANICCYKKYRNKLNGLLRKAERNHYDEVFTHNKNNLKKSWAIIKEVINKNKNKNKSISSKFVIDNNIISDNNVIAETFNKFYVNIGPSLAKKIPNCHKNPLSYINKHVSESMLLHAVDNNEVQNIITSLKEASPGWDNIHAKIIKCTYNLFLDQLTHILNLSLLQGVFPDQLKIARVIPLYKSDNSMLVNNYRPVSVLPVFSKILERLMYNRLYSFIIKHNIFYKYQFGFQKGHSTNMALIVLVDKIMSALDNGDFVLGVFIDLSKAFDTVNHKILLNKLYKYGFRGIVHEWLQSYLNNRKQYVIFSNCQSSQCSISCGVPQGSILGPLLFLLYVNDMVNASSVLFPILFADDTNIFLNGKNMTELFQTMNLELKNIVEWLNVNKLSLNVKKTHYMLFGLSKRRTLTNEVLCINNEVITKVASTKFLGVVIDYKLCWSEHIHYIKSKISKGIGILCKARKVLTRSTLLSLYYCFVYPYFTYCIEVWGRASEIYISSLVKLQKKILRIIQSASYRAHTAPIFLQLKILQLNKVYIYSVTMFMFKFFKGLLPNIFNDMFIRNTDTHNYSTRQSNHLHVPFSKLTTMYRTMKHQGAIIWNLMSSKITYDCKMYTYKQNLKSYLVSNDI